LVIEEGSLAFFEHENIDEFKICVMAASNCTGSTIKGRDEKREKRKKEE
jgi:hypothetical protein